MSKNKSKFYLVWSGLIPGLYDNWNSCKDQVTGYPGAAYRSFPTLELAQDAFSKPAIQFIGVENIEDRLTAEQLALIGKPIKESISVDGAWNTVTGVVEYQGVHTTSGKLFFSIGPFEDGTNNIVEFLGIVHALAYCKVNNLNLPIYSDSRNAINWVRDKQARTNHPRSDKNKKLYELIDRAIKWLNENEYSNQILKWETKVWGENPADYGRK